MTPPATDPLKYDDVRIASPPTEPETEAVMVVKLPDMLPGSPADPGEEKAPLLPG